MSLSYITPITADLSFKQYNIPDSDNINIELILECTIKGAVINTYQDVLHYENSIKIPYENYYREYLANNLPPESFNGREDTYNWCNKFLNGIDFVTYPQFYISTIVEKFKDGLTYYDDYYSKSIDITQQLILINKKSNLQ